MKALAAVARRPGLPFSLEQVELDELRPDEILIRMVAAGICHTDISAANQRLPVQYPIILGHEGAGIVEQTGSRSKQWPKGIRCCYYPIIVAIVTAVLKGKPPIAKILCKSPSAEKGRVIPGHGWVIRLFGLPFSANLPFPLTLW